LADRDIASLLCVFVVDRSLDRNGLSGRFLCAIRRLPLRATGYFYLGHRHIEGCVQMLFQPIAQFFKGVILKLHCFLVRKAIPRLPLLDLQTSQVHLRISEDSAVLLRFVVIISEPDGSIRLSATLLFAPPKTFVDLDL